MFAARSSEMVVTRDSSASGMAEGFLQGVDNLHTGKEGGHRGAAAALEEVNREGEFRAACQKAIVVLPEFYYAFKKLVAEFYRTALVERLDAFKYGPHQKAAQIGRRLVENDAGVAARPRKHPPGAGALGGQQQCSPGGPA
ncbi:hypothetical protein SBA2_580009 [Acidobacteriia bacterium SbA2]|nr:hypothetical protein SBA2_580009 [Acidobacteriia bacterium SbA2]